MYKEFSEYLKEYEDTLKNVFSKKYDINQFSKVRGLPVVAFRDIMSKNPLSVVIPAEYGGRGGKVKECLSLLASSAYESLSLSLTLGISMALFLEPVAKYANEPVKQEVFKRFIEHQNMGGLMITEPDFGSDALSMQTYNEKDGEHYKIKGTKHWQGLTGMADYWLIASRNKMSNGALSRDIDFFICDVTKEHQHIEVEEYYNNIGLYMIPYGKNKLDIRVPSAFKLQAQSSGIKLMLDTLHRSRMQFPGMAVGFIKRMLDESIKHCNERIVRGKSLLSLDQVKYQISKIQSSFTIASAMCLRSSKKSGIEYSLENEGIEANAMKAFVTDLMQESAQISLQLFGSKGFKMENISGRGVMDSRPFQIFEGGNEMLYTQITEMMLKQMKQLKQLNIYAFLKNFELTQRAIDYFKKDTNFTLDINLSQRKMVDLGKIFSRIIASNFVLEIEDKGFRKDLVDNCLSFIQQEVASLMSSFSFNNTVTPIEDYSDKGLWYQLA